MELIKPFLYHEHQYPEKSEEKSSNRGWRYPTEQIMDICKLAVETCYWPLFEVIEGKWILSYSPKKKLPIEDFLRTQGRFKHLFKPENEHLLVQYQEEVDRRWEDLLFRCSKN